MLTPYESPFTWSLPETNQDILDVFNSALSLASSHELTLVCCIEKINSYIPKDKPFMVNGVIKLTKSYGILLGLLTGRIPYREVPPAVWQRKLGCLTKGDKSVTKALAQQLYPTTKVTNANADALLIARYAQQYWK